jgi:hypothetical protein
LFSERRRKRRLLRSLQTFRCVHAPFCDDLLCATFTLRFRHLSGAFCRTDICAPINAVNLTGYILKETDDPVIALLLALLPLDGSVLARSSTHRSPIDSLALNRWRENITRTATVCYRVLILDLHENGQIDR